MLRSFNDEAVDPLFQLQEETIPQRSDRRSFPSKYKVVTSIHNPCEDIGGNVCNIFQTKDAILH